jgi:hypothetical protein
MIAAAAPAEPSRYRQRGRPGAGACALVAAIAAVALAGCGSGASRLADAPACLPTTLNHSAKLAGVPVDVSPTPGTGTADPHTQISFLGVPASEIRDVSVVGARSGRHAGRLDAYSQGDGASFLPAVPFDPGEQVVVHALIASTRIAFSFGVDTPYSTAGVGPFANPTPPPSDYQTFYTLPGVQAPIMTVTVPDRDPAAGDIFTSNGPGVGRYGAFIYTPQGRLVWIHQPSGGVVDDDLNVQSYEGQRDLTFWQGRVLSLGFGQGEDIVMNSRYQTLATVTGGNGLKADLHDFQIAPDDVAYITAYNTIRCNLSSAQGPRNGAILDAVVEEIDMRTGLVRWEWHSLDHVSVNESETAPPSGPWDWFHINSIDPEPGGDIFISARNTWAGYQLQGGSGTILWRLGGLDSSFTMGPGTKTYWQHDGRILPDGDVTFFDDGDDPRHEPQSRAVTIALDFKTHEARLVSAFTHPAPPLLAASQGNLQTLADANTLVGYGGVPEISEYSPDGALLFDAHLPYEMIFYRAFRFPWSAQPLSPPTALAGLNNVGETIVHMSWNGATDVASWRVLAGKQPGSLTPQTTIQTTGFESSTILPEAFTDKVRGHETYGYVAVEALGSAGQLLARSHTVAVATYRASFPTSERSG